MSDYFKNYSLKFYLKELAFSQGRTAKAGRNIIISFVFQGIGIIISFIYVPLLLDYFNQEQYGIWLTLISILGWFSFFDIGLGHGLRNKLAESIALNDTRLSKNYVSTTYAILCCIFLAILILFQITNFFLDWNTILNTKIVSRHSLYLLTSIVFSFMCINFVMQLIGTVYNANQYPAVNSIINTTGSFFSLIIVYILVKSKIHGDLVLFGFIISAMPVLLFLILSIYSYKTRYSNLKPSISSIDLKLGKGLMNLGGKFFLMQITSIIIFSTSSFFISQFFGPSEVVAYNITFKYFQVPVMIFSIILSPLWSAVTDAYVRSDFVWLKVTLKRLNILSIIFMIGIVIMVLISGLVFKFWIGDKVHIPYNLILLMAIYSTTVLFISPYAYFINGTGKIRLISAFSLVSILLFLSSVFFFSKLFQNSCALVLANIVTNIIGGVIEPVQTYKILNKKASGIWAK